MGHCYSKQQVEFVVWYLPLFGCLQVQMMNTRNADFFPIHLCVVALINTIVWTAFGLSTGDVFILVCQTLLGYKQLAIMLLSLLLLRMVIP